MNPGGGAILAGETINNPMGTAGSPQPLTLEINQFATGTGSDASNFGHLSSSLHVNKDLFIASLNPGDLATLDSFDQTYTLSGVPEPGVMLLTAGGLAFLVLRRRRFAVKGMSAVAVACLAVIAVNASPHSTDTV